MKERILSIGLALIMVAAFGLVGGTWAPVARVVQTANIVQAAPLAGGVNAVSGANGDVKIHDGDTEESPIVRNEPHVCTFHLHGFNFDANSRVDWAIETYPPTEPAGQQVLAGTTTLDGSGDGRTAVFSLPAGHYKLRWQQEGTPGADKWKVFWVECPNTTTSTTTTVVTATTEGTTTKAATTTAASTTTEDATTTAAPTTLATTTTGGTTAATAVESSTVGSTSASSSQPQPSPTMATTVAVVGAGTTTSSRAPALAAAGTPEATVLGVSTVLPKAGGAPLDSIAFLLGLGLMAAGAGLRRIRR